MSNVWYGSLSNRIAERAIKGQPDPEVGMGVTILHYSDRSAATVIQWHPLTGILVVQEDKAIRTDSNGMSESQDYKFETNFSGRRYNFKKNKDGVWKAVIFNKATRRWKQSGGVSLRIGERDAYHDYTF